MQQFQKQLPRPVRVQAKLQVHQPGDIYEQEADAMANRVMEMQKISQNSSARPVTGLIGKSVQRKCTECEEEEKKKLMRKTEGSTYGTQASPSLASSICASKGGGFPLPIGTQSFMENAFSTDFSRVRVHTDTKASEMSKGIDAKAFTTGSDIYFKNGGYRPDTNGGKHLLAHVVQQTGDSLSIQRDKDDTPPPSPGPRGNFVVHFPVIDELLTQVSDVHAGIAGRRLFADELAIVKEIFGNSVDYSRVRIILGYLAAGTTAGNNIRLASDFYVKKSKDEDTNPLAKSELSLAAHNHATLVHEMTHVWQFQHNGAGYITTSLLQQADASRKYKNRNFAYDYHIGPNDSFFEFAPEQQAFIVENYFKMLNDQQIISVSRDEERSYESNHLNKRGFPKKLNGTERSTEIEAELPAHAKLVKQMNSTPFISQEDLLLVRQKSVLITGPNDIYTPPGTGPQFAPTANLFEIRFGEGSKRR